VQLGLLHKCKITVMQYWKTTKMAKTGYVAKEPFLLPKVYTLLTHN